MLSRFPWMLLVLLAFAAYPLHPGVDAWTKAKLDFDVFSELPTIFIFGILALGLNVIVGEAGMLHLGIAAFFGLGAFAAAILRIENYPFQWTVAMTILAAMLFTTLMGILLSAPTLRLRGDYLALVTLGFGSITVVTLKNLEEITGGQKILSPITQPILPEFLQPLSIAMAWGDKWGIVHMFYLSLGVLAVVYVMLANVERSPLGRAWVAVREDEIAAGCMGINIARVKLAAFALGSALAGLAGALSIYKLGATKAPADYDFQFSVTVLCCLILGGLGNRRGVLLGVLFVKGYEFIVAPMFDAALQRASGGEAGKTLLTFSNWNLMLFGLTVILMMRFRPGGILPAKRPR